MALLRHTRLPDEKQDRIAGIIEWFAFRTERRAFFRAIFQGIRQKVNHGDPSISFKDYIRLTAMGKSIGDNRCTFLIEKFKTFFPTEEAAFEQKYKDELVDAWMTLLNPEGLKVHPMTYGLALTSLLYGITCPDIYFADNNQAKRYFQFLIEYEHSPIVNYVPDFELSYRRFSKDEQDLHKTIERVAKKINLVALGAL